MSDPVTPPSSQQQALEAKLQAALDRMEALERRLQSPGTPQPAISDRSDLLALTQQVERLAGLLGESAERAQAAAAAEQARAVLAEDPADPGEPQTPSPGAAEEPVRRQKPSGLHW